MNISEIIDSAIRETQTKAAKYTYPIFISDLYGKPELIGTSVIIELNSKYYLITASHVIRDVLNAKSPFIIGVNTKYVDIQNEFVYTTGNSDKDHFDIAFAELGKKFIESHNIYALGSNNLVTGQKFPSIHIGFIHGFPSSNNKQSKALYKTTAFKVKAYAYGGVIKDDFEDWDKFKKLKNTHTCMTYGNKSDGNIPIYPRGISGGGLWIIPDSSKPYNFYLDAIFIEYYKNYSITFSTKINKIIGFITNNHILTNSKRRSE